MLVAPARRMISGSAFLKPLWMKIISLIVGCLDSLTKPLISARKTPSTETKAIASEGIPG